MPRGTIKAADGGASDIWIGPSRERASLGKLHATNRLGPLSLADQILISDQRDGGCEDATPPSAANGGAEGNRTPDLLIANEALYQLSYSPISPQAAGYAFGLPRSQGALYALTGSVPGRLAARRSRR